MPNVKEELQAAQKNLTELRDELPQFQALLSENEGDAARLKTERAALDDQAQAKNRVLVAREMLEQHRADIQAAERRVAELQTASDDEDALAVIARASVKHADIQAALEKLFAETDAVLVAAIEQATALADEGNEHVRLAGQAVDRLIGKAGQLTYERDRASKEETYARAVQGTDVRPLTGSSLDNLQEWPADYGASPYKVLGHLNPHRANLEVLTVSPKPEPSGPTIDDFMAGLTD